MVRSDGRMCPKGGEGVLGDAPKAVEGKLGVELQAKRTAGDVGMNRHHAGVPGGVRQRSCKRGGR
jgi:hypothetical protein